MLRPMNYVYSGSVHTQDHGPGCSVAGARNLPRCSGVGSYCMPIQEGEIGVPAHPVEHLKPYK